MNFKHKINAMCLAEAPGAFVQYIIDKRHTFEDSIVCNTLLSTESKYLIFMP